MIQSRKLDCGITLVTESLPQLQAASIGIWVGAGSAYETPEISGISHYIEHMFFKGTKNRSYKDIAEQMDNLGAAYNAFTGKEYTCFHAKSITNVFPQCCDILFDMLTCSLFDEVEMDKERGVILEEMSMVTDTPDDIILDYLTTNVLNGCDVSNSILGSKKSLKGIHRKDILSYIKKEYVADHIVVSVVGNFDEALLEKQINDYMTCFKKKKKTKRLVDLPTKPKYSNKVRDISQSHLALGIPTLSFTSEDYYAQAIVNDILGGSMSSRLFQNIREEKGLAYTVFSSPLAYTYNGMLFIYGAVSLGKEADAVAGIGEELANLGREGLTAEDVQNVKQRLKAAYIFGQERLDSRMIKNGKNQLLLGRAYEEKDVMDEIDAVSLDQVNDYCKKISDITKYSGVSISKNKLDIKKMIKG